MPPPSGIRIVRFAFCGEDRGSVQERTVNDVTMARHPTGIGHAEIHIIILQIEHILHRDVRADHVAAVHVHHAFGFTGRAGGIENIERCLRIKRLGLGNRFFLCQPVVPVNFLRSGQPGG